MKEIIACVINNGDKIYSVNRSNSRCVKPHSHFRLIEFVQFSEAATGDSTLGKDSLMKIVFRCTPSVTQHLCRLISVGLAAMCTDRTRRFAGHLKCSVYVFLRKTPNDAFLAVGMVCSQQWVLFRAMGTVCSEQWVLCVPSNGYCALPAMGTVCSEQWVLCAPSNG